MKISVYQSILFVNNENFINWVYPSILKLLNDLLNFLRLSAIAPALLIRIKMLR